MHFLSARTLLFVSIILTAFFISAQAIAAETCQGCGLQHHGRTAASITITDWATNEKYAYRDLQCALRDMKTEYKWARARWTSPAGSEITLTRTDGEWEALPSSATFVTLAGDDCGTLLAFADSKSRGKWLQTHDIAAGNTDSKPLVEAPKAVSTTSAKSKADLPADVSEDHWAAPAVAAGAKSGLIDGYPDGTFRGSESVTRYELAVILQRLLDRFEGRRIDAEQAAEALGAELHQRGLSEADSRQLVRLAMAEDTPGEANTSQHTDAWTDVPEDHWASGAVDEATRQGLINGFPDGTFRGEEALSRYQLAVVLKRLTNRLKVRETGDASRFQSPKAGPGKDAQVTGASTGPAPEPELSAREKFIQKLREAGLSREQAEKALAALQEDYDDTRRQAEAQKADEATITKPANTSGTNHSKSTDTGTGVMGQSGPLMTPSAEPVKRDDAALTASTFSAGSNAVAATAAVGPDSEMSIAATSGDLPDALVISARHNIYANSDGRTRGSIGVLDATDEIDTTVYGVLTRDFGDTNAHTPPSASVGLGGGDLLDGLFFNANIPLGARLSAFGEWTEVGTGDSINTGLHWLPKDSLSIKAGATDGDFAGSLSLRGDL